MSAIQRLLALFGLTSTSNFFSSVLFIYFRLFFFNEREMEMEMERAISNCSAIAATSLIYWEGRE
jgi:hypothetical protein